VDDHGLCRDRDAPRLVVARLRHAAAFCAADIAAATAPLFDRCPAGRHAEAMRPALTAAVLLVCSNVFMTTAWYGHLRFRNVSLPVAILLSWGIAFFEYLLQVPANRIGYGRLSGYQLKILQEAISLTVFVGFAVVWLGEPPTWRYAGALALVVAAVAVAFG
jgi:uncharacterized protein (DUF486 family)